ncbi:peptidyl-tRNA hydrolase 2 [Zopfochytrium polystomum]|nr:peptidyl-tRNA hydrolase 2 [Zopfochytrium polystomum]
MAQAAAVVDVLAYVLGILTAPKFSLLQLLSACIISLITATYFSSSRFSGTPPAAPSSGAKVAASQKSAILLPAAAGSGSDADDDASSEDDNEGRALLPADGSIEWKMVLVVRTDLEMGKGKVAAQCCHATLAAYNKMRERDPASVKRWERWGQAKITLKCNSEEEMLDLQQKARSAGLVAQSIQDAGRTQIAAGSRTVLAIGPGPKNVIDGVTGHLKLY